MGLRIGDLRLEVFDNSFALDGSRLSFGDLGLELLSQSSRFGCYYSDCVGIDDHTERVPRLESIARPKYQPGDITGQQVGG